jgi:hypothetical protein
VFAREQQSADSHTPGWNNVFWPTQFASSA